ncbi:MAG TPA: hypothetical protein VGO56_19295 [Pyrinomonadaceae bacterium]|jgi:hypothetical protein|nr:hypothetical protein [Pyrinomonadaceae bacterium]
MKLTIRFLFVLVFLVLDVPSVCGQSGTPVRGRTDPVQSELQRCFESEAIERALAKTPRPRAEHEQRMVVLQIKIDFLRIQTINDDLKVAAHAGLPDLNAVTKSASAITKCAKRLKENLALPEIEKSERPAVAKVDMGIEQLRVALAALNKSINAFVENPVFERLGVIDAELSLQARRDLDQIIEVSKLVKRGSEKLYRARGRIVGEDSKVRRVASI